jgi:hypothetical protein
VSKGGPKPNLFENFSAQFLEDRDPEAALLWDIVCSVTADLPSRGPGADFIKLYFLANFFILGAILEIKFLYRKDKNISKQIFRDKVLSFNGI